MYGKGMTTRDISSHIKDIYGFIISETMVSKITNKILPTIEKSLASIFLQLITFVGKNGLGQTLAK